MVYFLLSIFSSNRRKTIELEDDKKTQKKVSAAVSRLESLTDRLEDTTNALEDLLSSIRREEEARHE